MFDVISFGSAVVDVFLDTDIAEKGKFMCYPVGSKILMKNLRFSIGGGGTNSSVAFSRFGFKTGYIGKIGDDNYGKEVIKMLKNEKIKFLGKMEKETVSGYSIVLDSKENNRTILTYKGINNHLNFSELNLKKIKTKWLYLSSLLGDSFNSQKKLVKILNKKNTKIAFNPSDYLIKKNNLRDLLKYCKVLILNKEEAMLLSNLNDSNKLLENLYKLIKTNGIVVITNGNKKISAYNGKNKFYLMPSKIKIIEKTGAGDAFASGFVSGQMLGKTIQDSLKLGLIESQSVIKHFGAKNKLLKRNLK